MGGGGLRYEADWPPIQRELIRLEAVRREHPEIRQRVTQLLQYVTDAIDYDLGLRDEQPPMPPEWESSSRTTQPPVRITVEVEEERETPLLALPHRTSQTLSEYFLELAL